MKMTAIFPVLLLLALPSPAQGRPEGKIEEYIPKIRAKLEELSKEDPLLLSEVLSRLSGLEKAIHKKFSSRDLLAEATKMFEKTWDAVVQAMEEENLPWKENHFLETSKFFLERNDGPRALRICLAGARRYPKSRYLLDNLGLAYLLAAREAKKPRERTQALKKAYRAFKRAVRLKPDTYHAHFGLFQAAYHLGRYETALEELEKYKSFKDAPRPMKRPRTMEGKTLLGAGRFDKAAALLKDPATLKEDSSNGILAVRALALAGKTEEALALAEELEKKGVDPRLARWAKADLLIFLGKRKEAVRFLKKHPVKRKKDETEAEFKLARQAQAGLRYLSLLTPKTVGKIRRGLPKILDHKFILFLPGKGKKPKEMLLNSSSIAMAKLMINCPPSAKIGENTVYLALLSLDLQRHKPTFFEKKYVLPYKVWTDDVKKLGTPDGLRECIRKLRRGLLDPEFNCALTAWKLAQYLETKLE